MAQEKQSKCGTDKWIMVLLGRFFIWFFLVTHRFLLYFVSNILGIIFYNLSMHYGHWEFGF